MRPAYATPRRKSVFLYLMLTKNGLLKFGKSVDFYTRFEQHFHNADSDDVLPVEIIDWWHRPDDVDELENVIIARMSQYVVRGREWMSCPVDVALKAINQAIFEVDLEAFRIVLLSLKLEMERALRAIIDNPSEDGVDSYYNRRRAYEKAVEARDALCRSNPDWRREENV